MKDFNRKEFQQLARPVLDTKFYDEDAWECEDFYRYATETEEEDEYNGPTLGYEDVMDAVEGMVYRLPGEPILPAFARLLDYVYAAAIENEDADRINNYGALFYDGRIGEQNFKKAAELYKIADRLGNPNATCNLGYIYYYGRTGEPDYQQAYKYFSKSALRDEDPIAYYKLGDLFKNGYYVEKDLNAAFTLYEKSYDLYSDDDEDFVYGEYWSRRADAAFRLGDCYLNGLGVEADPMEALKYLQEAERGFVHRISNGDYFVRKMLSATIEKENEARQRLSASLPSDDWARSLTGYSTL